MHPESSECSLQREGRRARFRWTKDAIKLRTRLPLQRRKTLRRGSNLSQGDGAQRQRPASSIPGHSPIPDIEQHTEARCSQAATNSFLLCGEPFAIRAEAAFKARCRLSFTPNGPTLRIRVTASCPAPIVIASSQTDGNLSDLISPAARAIARGKLGVAICGECASILWAHGKADAAIQV